MEKEYIYLKQFTKKDLEKLSEKYAYIVTCKDKFLSNWLSNWDSIGTGSHYHLILCKGGRNMNDFKKVSLDELYKYLATTFTKLYNQVYLQYASDWMEEIREFENNANETDGNLYIYDTTIYNKNGESERLTIAFKYITFNDGTVDVEYYLPKTVNI